MSDSDSKWIKKTVKLKEGHEWKGARPGYNVFVADRGAVRFDFPQDWIIEPGENGSIKFLDKPSPDDNCTLQFSVFYLPPEIDWSGLPLSRLIQEVDKDESRTILSKGEIVEANRPGLEIAWVESRFMDPNEARPAYSRLGLARGENITVLLTFAYWSEDAPKFRPVWDAVFDSMILGQYIDDPATGKVRPPAPADKKRRRKR